MLLLGAALAHASSAEHTTVLALPFPVAKSRYSASSDSLASAAADIGLLPTVLPTRFRAPVGVKCGVKSTADSRKPCTQAPGPSHKPDSALSRHPSPGDSRASPSGNCAYQSRAVREPPYRQFGLLAPVVYLAGPSGIRLGIPPVGSYPTLSPITCATANRSHRLVCSLLHLT